MKGLLLLLKRLVTPRLSDDQARLVEILKRDPHIRVAGRGLVVRTGFTDEGRERFNQKAAEIAHLVENGECHLCANRRWRVKQ